MGTISKALNLLNYFSEASPEIGLSEFRALSGKDKATVYRYLCELEESGFVEQDRATKRYRIGSAVLRLANMREKTFPARDAVAPIVRSLSNELGELVHMSLLQGGMLSPLYHYDVGAHGVHVHYDEGEMLPLHATASGIAVLAYSAPDFVQEFLGKPLPQITPKTPTNTEDLLGMIKRVHSQGYGEVSKTFDKDVASFAVPIFDSEQRVIGALAVAIPAARSSREKKREIVHALKRAGNAVTQAFGGITPSNVERLTA